MHTRTKTLGAAAAIAAIATSLPLAVTAYAEPETTTEAEPTVEIPDPQGPGCDDFKKAVPSWKALNDVPVSQALAAIPEISTFNAAVSGGLNPAVNIDPVLDNGPYVVFAPTNEAFAKLAPGQLDAIAADPAALTSLDYYHAFLGLLGNDDVKGQRPTQQGAEIKVDRQGRRHRGQRHRQARLWRDPRPERPHLPDRHRAGPEQPAGGADPYGVGYLHHADDHHGDHRAGARRGPGVGGDPRGDARGRRPDRLIFFANRAAPFPSGKGAVLYLVAARR
jgi:hypothetical protein